MKRLIGTVAKVLLGAALFFAGTLVGSLMAGGLGLPAPSLPAGSDAQTLGLLQLPAGLLFAATLAVLACALAGGTLVRWAALALFAWAAYGLNTYLEAAIFNDLFRRVALHSGHAGRCRPAVQRGHGLALPRADARARRRLAAGPSAPLFTGGWAWRLLAALAAFPAAYLFFGSLVEPYVSEFYWQQTAELTLPAWEQILPTLALRSLLFLLSGLPVLILWRGSRRRLFLLLGLAWFVLVGGLYMLQAYWYPATLRLAHSLEILADSLAYAGVLTLLFAGGREGERAARPA